MLHAFETIYTLLLSAAVLAAPAANADARHRLDARLGRRLTRASSSALDLADSLVAGPFLPSVTPEAQSVEASQNTNTSQVTYSENWSGVVLSAPAGTWKGVTGTFVIPTPKVPSGGSTSTTYAASAWVGIDGFTCTSAIFQTGVDFYISNGKVSFDGWYEWYPDYAYDYSGITFSAGDTVKLTIAVSSTKAGTASISNLTTGKTVSKSLTSSIALCEQDAEWIVEDFSSGSTLVPFANFGAVTWTNMCAVTATNSCVKPTTNETIVEIQQSGKVYTSVSVTATGATISYV
ncbi:hypothetical protein DL93DRAFT_545530 [Clavulina sp. PMI_390]|nr:hypothetical protein DL93DRAFT_545530 [Clavulina sp. PMI_390]